LEKLNMFFLQIHENLSCGDSRMASQFFLELTHTLRVAISGEITRF